MPDKLYWESMNYKVIDYPEADVLLEFYTLSVNKDFISVSNKLFGGLLLIVLLTNYSVARTQVDPTRPAINIDTNTGVTAVQDEEIRLNSIIQSAQATYAVINNRIYHKVNMYKA